jgi:hypothetical protein
MTLVSDFVRLARSPGLVPAEMTAHLEVRLAELVMHQLAPCDLGDGIEVVHDVERLEIEMECDLGDDAPVDDACLREASDPDKTLELDREAIEALVENDRTHELVRFSAPYERIEIELDAKAFLRATIEEAKSVSAARRQPNEP